MEDKIIHLIAGLPRSGSTLLCNILNQNPRFHATSTSGILDIVLMVRNQWENINEFKASPNKMGKDAVMKPILQNYYSTVNRPVVFDKSRGWGGYLELAEYCLGGKVKMIVPVRRIVDILASFEKLTRLNSSNWQLPQEKTNYFEIQTLAGRADVWMHNDQPVGIAYNRIQDAVDRGFRDQMHFIEFENLTKYPRITMKNLYAFLGEQYFEHDFDNVQQTTSENDDIHGIPGLHTIRNVVLPFDVEAEKIIGHNAFTKFSNAEFWRS